LFWLCFYADAFRRYPTTEPPRQMTGALYLVDRLSHPG
jgi:hypothetical protein